MTDRIHVLFDEIAALAATERRVHPDPWHHREVDGTLENLRQRMRGYVGEAAAARSIGNGSVAESILAEGAHLLIAERRVWEARLAAAEAAAGRERDKATAAAAGNLAAIRAGGAISGVVKDFGVRDACRAHRQRVEMIEPAIDADAADFAERLDDLEAAVRFLNNSIGIARRELRLKQAATRADQAVAARLAA